MHIFEIPTCVAVDMTSLTTPAAGRHDRHHRAGRRHPRLANGPAGGAVKVHNSGQYRTYRNNKSGLKLKLTENSLMEAPPKKGRESHKCVLLASGK